MKMISFAVPCYNSQDYMRNCIESLLTGGDRVEILIVDDGSKDNTLQIAREYENNYPDLIRVIHKENGGHGDALMAGLAAAVCPYFKVVDSDDWVDTEALQQVLDVLETQWKKRKPIDMLITNYVYCKQGARRQKVMRYTGALPVNRMFTWNDRLHIKKWHYILMHSVTYRTELVRRSGMRLPKHTFYVDNIYLYQPLAYMKNLYYLDVNLYQYYIGRADQSVNEQVMVGRIDQQLRVNKMLFRIYNAADKSVPNLHKYMLQYMDMMMCVASVFLNIDGSERALCKKRELWGYLKRISPGLYRKMRWSLFGIIMNLPGKAGRAIGNAAYRVTQKIFGFN